MYGEWLSEESTNKTHLLHSIGCFLKVLTRNSVSSSHTRTIYMTSQHKISSIMVGISSGRQRRTSTSSRRKSTNTSSSLCSDSYTTNDNSDDNHNLISRQQRRRQHQQNCMCHTTSTITSTTAVSGRRMYPNRNNTMNSNNSKLVSEEIDTIRHCTQNDLGNIMKLWNNIGESYLYCTEIKEEEEQKQQPITQQLLSSQVLDEQQVKEEEFQKMNTNKKNNTTSSKATTPTATLNVITYNDESSTVPVLVQTTTTTTTTTLKPIVTLSKNSITLLSSSMKIILQSLFLVAIVGITLLGTSTPGTSTGSIILLVEATTGNTGTIFGSSRAVTTFSKSMMSTFTTQKKLSSIAFALKNHRIKFTQKQQEQLHPKWILHASTLSKQTGSSSSSTSSQGQVDSDRLKKAKILLEQYEQGDETTLVPPTMMLMASSNNDDSDNDSNVNEQAEYKRRVTTGSRVAITQKPKKKQVPPTVSTTPWNVATPIVPDTYWTVDSDSLDDFDPTSVTSGNGIVSKKTTSSSSSKKSQQQQQQQVTTSTSTTGSTSPFQTTRWARGGNVAEPLVQYDPIKAEKILFRQPTKWVIRNFQIAVPLGWWAVTVVVDYFLYDILSLDGSAGGKDDESISSSSTSATTLPNTSVGTSTTTATSTVSSSSSSKKSIRRRIRAQQLTKAISNLGPAIIKGGQALASRPDLLPAEYLEELQKLQDDVPRFSNALAIQTVEQELNINKFTDLFELIQAEPVAAASIGQVYKARLIENGDIIALKIQRPYCEEIVALDLYILRWWSGIYNTVIYNLLNRDIDLQNIIDDFGILIYRELDYIAEASNAQRFNELYAADTNVFVPKIYSDYTTSRVLTMEWVDGYRITDTKIITDELNLNVSNLVNTLVQCSLRQILENGFFHADPHAGNLLACPDGRLCYLDFGMMSYANQKQRNGFLLAVVHIVNRDWDELAKLYVKLGFIPVGTDLAPIVIALDRALPDVLNADISELNFKNVINSLGEVFYTFPFSLPPFYIAIIRCLGVLEGLAIQVDPSIKVLSKSYPYVASRVLTDRQEDLQEAFRRLVLTNDGRMRWDRLESLLDQATDVSDYNAAAALDVLTDYALADDDNALLDDLAIQIVNYVDTLSIESGQYVLDVLKSFAINDEVAAVRSFRALSNIVQNSPENDSGTDDVKTRLTNQIRDGLPEMTPTMKRLATISTLLLGTGSSSDSTNNGDQRLPLKSSSASTSLLSSQDPTKFVPIIRKLSSSVKVQQTANEIVARLGERLLSRTLRNIFGLPPPSFGSTFNGRTTTSSSSTTTVTEDKK